MRNGGALIVCAPSPRVGVTTTARLLAEWCALNDRPFEVYDTDSQFAPIRDYFPNETIACDLGSIDGQIRIFEDLLRGDGVCRIVDLWCRSYRRFLDMAVEIGFYREAARLGVPIYVLFLAEPTVASAAAARDIAKTADACKLLVVANEGAVDFRDFLERGFGGFPTTEGLRIPSLDEAARNLLELNSYPLRRFLEDPPDGVPLVVRVRLRDWVARVFRQLNAFDLQVALRQSSWMS